jgi:hypothetical protein
VRCVRWASRAFKQMPKRLLPCLIQMLKVWITPRGGSWLVPAQSHTCVRRRCTPLAAGSCDHAVHARFGRGGWSRYVRIRYRTDTRCTFRGKESDRVNSRLAIVATFIGELRGGRIYKFSDLPMAGITQPLDESVGTDLVARASVKFRRCLVLRLMATKQ